MVNNSSWVRSILDGAKSGTIEGEHAAMRREVVLGVVVDEWRIHDFGSGGVPCFELDDAEHATLCAYMYPYLRAPIAPPNETDAWEHGGRIVQKETVRL